MRFGLDFDSEVLPARSPRHAFHEPASAFPKKVSPRSPRTQVALAIDLLHDTLQRINALQILKLEEGQTVRRKLLASISETGKSRAAYIKSVVDSIDASERSRQDEEVRQIVEQHERLRREEEERQRLAREEEERERLQKEALLREEKKRKEEQEKLEKERKLQEEKAKAAEQKRLKEKIRLAKEEAARKAKGPTDWEAIEKLVFKYRQDIQDIKKDVVEAMDSNKDFKKQVNVYKRRINVKFGQLSSSETQMNTISREVAELANATKQNPLAYKWILNFIAKAVVAQAEAEVTVKPSAAVPLAGLAANLLNSLDGLEYYLCARLAKKCAFILGYTCSIDTEEGRARMGWKRSDGKWEAEVKYEERVGGIATVWAVMARLQATQRFDFFSMAAEWRFAARILNVNKDLLGNVHYGIICNWWEAAGAQLAQKYGKQAYKLLEFAAVDWAKYGQQKLFPAATRLEILGEDLRSKRSFNSIRGMDR